MERLVFFNWRLGYPSSWYSELSNTVPTDDWYDLLFSKCDPSDYLRVRFAYLNRTGVWALVDENSEVILAIDVETATLQEAFNWMDKNLESLGLELLPSLGEEEASSDNL